MKNFFKARIVPLFAIIALVTVIGFSMAACDSGGGSGGGSKKVVEGDKGENPFIGTWNGTDSGMKVKIVITSSGLTATWSSSPPYEVKGTYTYSGNKATFKLSDGDVYQATVSENTMTLSHPDFGEFDLEKE